MESQRTYHKIIEKAAHDCHSKHALKFDDKNSFEIKIPACGLVLSKYVETTKDLQYHLKVFNESDGDEKVALFKELLYYQAISKNCDELMYNTMNSMKNNL